MSWQPVAGNIMTRWAKDVSPENAWQEYPRPQLTRTAWMNLNGLWDYWIIEAPEQIHKMKPGKILVPFPVESALSGVKKSLNPGEFIIYRRSFSIPEIWSGKRILVHFGAVDWQASVAINGHQAGTHTGGYLPFCFDITEYLLQNEAQNELQVIVSDPTDSHWQQRGKQVLKPKSIWYTAVSGIWQTVWLEPVPQTYISGLKIIPDIDRSTVVVQCHLAGREPGNIPIRVSVSESGKLLVEEESQNQNEEIIVRIPNPKLWSPVSPHLYDIQVTAGEDQVGSYFGMRKFSLESGRLCLNGDPYFQLGPLDQGYWPDGLYTPPSDAAMLSDIELVKRLGFNMLRKHVKVEPARYYYYCDRIGLIVWQDMPNGGRAIGDVTSTLTMVFGSRRKDKNHTYAGREDQLSRQDFHRELKELVDHLYSFPCIGMWVPFNEGWGQFDANETGQWLSKYDPTRWVDHASGWFDQGGGDCKSLHVYKLKLPAIKPDSQRAIVLSEFGGYSLKLDGHLWNPAAEFGYQSFKSSQALTDAYLKLFSSQLIPWVNAGLSAAIYTQTTDVEIEVNGFVTYDREVEKMDFNKIQKIHYDILHTLK